MTTPPTASDTMKSIGIVQEGDPVLTQPARHFDLPGEASAARKVVAALHAAADRAAKVHSFSKGMGVAAPQVGLSWRAAIVRPPEGDVIVLLNPTVVEESPEIDEQYEVAFPSSMSAERFPVRVCCGLSIKIPMDRPGRRRSLTGLPGWSRTSSTIWTACCTCRG